MRRLEIAREDELLPFLKECLIHYHDRLKSSAARVLVNLGDESDLNHSIDALVGPPSNVRRESEWAILSFDDSPLLIAHMQRCLRRHDDEILVNIDSIEELAKLGDEPAIPCLIDALNAGDDDVRAVAAQATARFGIGRTKRRRQCFYL